MTYVRKLTAFALAGAFLTLASSALADALPPDAEDCETKMEGATCTTAEGDAGVCTTEMCPSENHGCVVAALDSGADAASCESSYACVLCVAGGSAVVTTDAGMITDAGITTTTTTTSGDSGCAVNGTSVSEGLRGAAPFALALLVPLALRRKKKTPKDDAKKPADRV